MAKYLHKPPIISDTSGSYGNLERSAGYSLLELAAALPIVLLLTLFGFDILNLFRVSEALREGATVVARQIATLDGIGHEIVTSDPGMVYRWSQYQVVTVNGNPRMRKERIGISSVAPSICQRSACMRELVQPGDLPSLSGEQVERREAYEKAITLLGQKELRSILPRVRFDCQGGGDDSNCSDINVAINDRGDTATVTVRYKLPVLVLGNTPITLVARTSERLEESISDGEISARFGQRSPAN